MWSCRPTSTIEQSALNNVTFLSKEETFPLWVSLVLVTTLVLITICWRKRQIPHSTWTALVCRVKGETLRSLIDGECGWSCRRLRVSVYCMGVCLLYVVNTCTRRMWMNSEDRNHWDSDQSHEEYNCDSKLSSALTKAEKLENLHTASGALPVAQS